MTKRQFEKVLTPELITKLRRIAAGVLKDRIAAEDAVQTALWRITGWLPRLKKVTPAFLATRVVLEAKNRWRDRASNASRELLTLSGDLEETERTEFARTYGERTEPRKTGEDGDLGTIPGPTDLWRE